MNPAHIRKRARLKAPLVRTFDCFRQNSVSVSFQERFGPGGEGRKVRKGTSVGFYIADKALELLPHFRHFAGSQQIVDQHADDFRKVGQDMFPFIETERRSGKSDASITLKVAAALFGFAHRCTEIVRRPEEALRFFKPQWCLNPSPRMFFKPLGS
ncbi:MAG TPA: hypothetical protein VMU57_22485 [Edaphobacter sp.]|uniref:hypothetical protein n=1 Tax=Edaphobacter sp. TaxID=1934404 RepID=UPI002CC2F758|nr:hypothetical protein [Edaphobacter sp.]HUZ97682.1 hypothetical protein [Edaphobacter sp.]